MTSIDLDLTEAVRLHKKNGGIATIVARTGLDEEREIRCSSD